MKKRTKIYNINLKTVAFLCIGVSIFSSCNKNEKLNPKATTLITDKDAFATPERIEAQVNSLYANLKGSNFLGSYYSIISEIRAGDFVANTTNAAVGFSSYQLNVQNSTNEVGDIWVAGYQAINKVNVFIDGMNASGSTVVTEAKSKNYIAEARLVRAVAYYYLLQLYAQPYWKNMGNTPGLPLRLTGIKTLGNFDMPRSTVAQTYQQIIDDLDYAEANLPSTQGSNVANMTRGHKNTAIALKTRVYLNMLDYPKVILEANKIVSLASPFTASTGVAHALQADIVNVFKPNASTSESIFSMPFTNNDRPGTSIGSYFLPPNGTAEGGTALSNGNGNYLLDPNGILAATSWTSTDDRRKFVSTGSTGKKYLTKFSQASPYLDSAPVIRYSEVLLNLAEALVRSTNTVDARALSILHDVRYRADKNTNFDASSFANDTDFLNAILNERHIEFLGEGLRNMEVMRLGLDIPAKPAHSIPAAAPSAPSYIFPIPINELLLNKAMVDN